MQRYKRVGTIRAAAILTGSYAPATVISDAQNFNHLSVGVFFTIGNLTNLKLKLESSHDNSVWRQETTQTISGGVITEAAADHTYTATGNVSLEIDVSAPYLRISALGTGDATNSSLSLDATLTVR